MAQNFHEAPEKISFPEVEKSMSELWERIKAFETSLKLSEGRPEYTFLDGPPFATGLPHYGHILAGTIKDIICRFFHQKGYHVRRQWGWDTHGLPIEFEIDKQLGIRTKDQVLELGIEKYNAECRKIVMRYAAEWETSVARTGRWIDFKNDYKTMYPWFMESIWWIFNELHKQGLVYRGVKVMPYSTACTTPLSNFEANQAYRDVVDPSLIVNFPLRGGKFEDGRKLVAWTTTPWTLPSNLALCVNENMDYVLIRNNVGDHKGDLWYVMEARLPQLYPEKKGKKKAAEPEYTVIEKLKGKDLVGLEYEPLFNCFESYRERGAFHVISDSFVSADSGTGIVHCAPGFGEDDFRVCMANGIIGKKVSEIPCPVDMSGRFTNEVPDWEGVYIKDADKEILKTLKERGRLVSKTTITHSYPFCWRSDTPLIYRAVPSWFVNVEEIRDKLVEANNDTYWVPDFVKEKRFKNWLENARDWCVSRSRYWGTPLPLWVSEDYEEVVCVGSIEQLYELTGVRVTDLHRESIDGLTFEHKGQTMRRVEEVFDCWFESGSMPFASRHYPFENKEEVDAHYPADFIAEGLDQTRGWFYTLMVIGVAIKGAAPFKNLIVNGLVLAADGKKMSKRLRNFPDPTKVMDEVGADALRLYLVNSPVVRAESLRFTDAGVVRTVKEVFLPWYNAYRFFVQNANIYALGGELFSAGPAAGAAGGSNIMDRWIEALLQSLIAFVHKEIEAYRLFTVVPRLVGFLEQLTNWYVRFNRRRLKGDYGREGQQQSLATLYEVLMSMSTIMAPLNPFLCEYMYQNLRLADPEKYPEESVHYRLLPQPREDAMDEGVERGMRRLEAVVGIVRLIRDRNVLPVKTPIKEITIVHRDPQYHEDLKSLQDYMTEELNVKSIIHSTAEEEYVTLQAVTEDRVLGRRFGRALKDIKAALAKVTPAELEEFEATHALELKVEVDGVNVVLSDGDVEVTRLANPDGPGNGEGLTTESGAEGVVVVVDLAQDESIIHEGIARDVVSRIQRMRKTSKLVPTDLVDVFYECQEGDMQRVFEGHTEPIERSTNSVIAPVSRMGVTTTIVLMDETYEFALGRVRLVMVRRGCVFDMKKLVKLCGGDASLADSVRTAVAQRDYSEVLKAKTPLKMNVDGKSVEVTMGDESGVYLSLRELKL